MNCSNCGEAIQPGQRFCPSCGNRLGRACESCAAALPEGASFCPSCGAPTGAPAGAPATLAPSRAVPAPSSPIVERRLVSVLFVDLVGFTDLATQLDPEETRDLQSRYFARAREIVERYGGTVEKFIGDAVMAVWGAPIANEDDPERAVRAALDLTVAIPELPAPRPLQARAGVATGEAAVTFGADGQGMVSGDTVNLAARLEAAAENGTVVTDQATRRASEASVVFEPAREQQLKGFERPVATSRAVRIVAGRRGSGRTDELEAPFVGRTAEITLLKELFHATVRERRLRLVSITGQAGIGKSRLAWEFEKYIDGITGDVYWHKGRSPSYGEGITFWALGEMVRRRAAIAEDDDEATTTAKVSAMLAEHVPDTSERARLALAMDALLGLPCEAETERGELFGAWRTLFERLADTGPVVLVFEDLQWADGGLIEFIGHLLEWSRRQPIFVVTLARPELLERFPTWGAGQRNFTSLDLEPLVDEEMRALMAGLVPGLPAATVRAILQRAEGVPLYAVEIVKMLVSDGRLVREGTAFRMDRSIDEVSIPTSLHALVAARLDGLAPADRTALQRAAVLGTSFSMDALAAVSGQSADELGPALDRLVGREILRVETDARSPERGQYQFVQAVIREVAYQTLTRKDRKERHLAAARFLEALGGEEVASALACHYLDAWRSATAGAEADTLAAQARVALRGASERATNLHSYEQALRFLTLALDVAADDGERADLLERGALAAWHAARTEESEAMLRRAIGIQRDRAADRLSEARLVLRLGLQLNALSRPRDALALLEAGRPPGGDVDAERIGCGFDAELARACFLGGDNQRAIDLADVAVGCAERLDDLPVLVDALITKGSALGYVRPREGQATLYGAVVLADRYGLTRQGLRGRNNLAWSVDNDDPAAGLELTRECMAIAVRLGRRDEVLWSTNQVAFRLIARGETAEAKSLVEELLADETLSPLFRWFMLAQRANIAAIEGDPELAESLMDQADTVQTGMSNPEQVAIGFAIHGVVAFFGGDERAALSRFEAAVREDPGGSPHTGWRCDVGLLYVRAGRIADARDVLAVVRTLPERGRLLDARRLELEAAIAAAEGRPEAARLFLEAIRLLRELGLGLDLAHAQLNMIRALGSGDPAARAEADDLLDTARRKGWGGFLRLLEPLVVAPTAASARSSVPADSRDEDRMRLR